jgi:hypothetical protein
MWVGGLAIASLTPSAILCLPVPSDFTTQIDGLNPPETLTLAVYSRYWWRTGAGVGVGACVGVAVGVGVGVAAGVAVGTAMGTAVG